MGFFCSLSYFYTHETDFCSRHLHLFESLRFDLFVYCSYLFSSFKLLSLHHLRVLISFFMSIANRSKKYFILKSLAQANKSRFQIRCFSVCKYGTRRSNKSVYLIAQILYKWELISFMNLSYAKC